MFNFKEVVYIYKKKDVGFVIIFMKIIKENKHQNHLVSKSIDVKKTH
jgi:hypothetical protein